MNPSSWQCWCFPINISEPSLIIDEALQQHEKITCPAGEVFGFKPCWRLVMYIPLRVLIESGMKPYNAVHRPLWTAKVTNITQQCCFFQGFWSPLWLLYRDLLEQLTENKQAAGEWRWDVETPMQVHMKQPLSFVVLKFCVFGSIIVQVLVSAVTLSR